MRSPTPPKSVTVPTTISPTQVQVARECALRFALDKATMEPDCSLPSPTASRYAGDALHKLIELARRGEAGEPPGSDRLKEWWHKLIPEFEEKAERNGDHAWVPFQESIAHLERTRLCAVRIASAQRVHKVPAGASTGKGSTETNVSSSCGTVVGRIDAIDRQGDRLVIQDFKSGPALDSTGTVKPQFIDQMLIYAALYAEDRGSVPDALEIVDKTGRAIDVPFTEQSAHEALESTRQSLAQVRDKMGGCASIGFESAALLANPDSDACGMCRHRPVCPGYLQKLKSAGFVVLGDQRFPTVDVFGKVSDAMRTADGRVRLLLESHGVRRSIHGLSAHGGFVDALAAADPPPPLPSGGAEVAVFGARPRRSLEQDPDHERLVVARPTRAFLLQETGGLVLGADEPVAPYHADNSETEDVRLPTPGDLLCSGSCKGNPGPGSWSVSRLDSVQPDSATVSRHGEFERGTNNQAEFLAIVAALDEARQGAPGAVVWSTSQTAIRWIEKRAYKKASASDAALQTELDEAEKWVQAELSCDPASTATEPEGGGLVVTVRKAGRGIAQVRQWKRGHASFDRAIPSGSV